MIWAEAARGRLIVALDFNKRSDALRMVDGLGGRCLWFKVGMELFYAEGREIIADLRARGNEVFLDLKLHDIPNTVAGAVRSVAGTGASLLTVHASGGPAMLAAAVEASAGSPRLLGVTVLTSMDPAQLEAVGVEATPRAQVRRLGQIAAEAGLNGLVCSADEVADLRQDLGNDVLLVVPGIRPAGAELGDQRRVASPAEALRRGASMLVVGRPITSASDPARAADAILEEMQQELERSGSAERY